MNFFNLTDLFKPTSTPHPFKKKVVVDRFHHVEEVEPEDNIVSTSWGKSKVVKAKHVTTDKFVEWSIEEKDSVRLKSVDLDKFDLAVIREKKLSIANYRLVKPYVISGEYTNKEIATILTASKSWVERLTPRIKEAVRNRRKSAPIVKK